MTAVKQNKEKLVPELRFREFQNRGEWDKKNLSEVSNFHDNKRKPIKESERAKRKGIYPYYGASGIIDYVDDYIFDGEYVLLGEDGANIITRNSPLAFLIQGKCWINNHAHVIEALGSNKFLAESLERIDYRIYNTGTAQPKLNSEVCKKIDLKVPTLPEQEKIATFLTAVDEKLQQLNRKKELLTEYKKGVMQKLFPPAGGPVPELRFKDANGADFPDWEEKRLGEVVLDYRLGGNYTNTEVETKHPLIKMGNLGRGSINLKKLEYIPIGEEINSKDRIQYGDLFFNTRNTLDLVGKVSIWRNELPEAYYNSNLMYLKFNINFFMNYRLNSYEGIKSLKSFATGTTSVAAIYTKDLLKLKLNIPCSEEQQKIASFLSGIDEKITQVGEQITQTQDFKKGLLQQLFV